jgi:uncharacterized protein YbjT (DUF2867 family)
MKVIVFGATGMIGQGVLRECLLDEGVDAVVAVGRTGTGVTHDKLNDIAHADLFDLSPIEAELTGADACFFCLGVSSAGMSEDAYRRITYDLTVSAAQTLARTSPGLTFVYVSGLGTDSTEQGRSMWARVKGRTENALLAMPFQAYMFRPGFIQPMHGARSRTRSYRIFYSALGWLVPLLRKTFPKRITTTEQIGRAMLRVARAGAPKHVLESPDIVAVANTASGRRLD